MCLRKFVNAGKFYGVDAVVMGGDITGKMIVPVVEEGAGPVRRAASSAASASSTPTGWPG